MPVPDDASYPQGGNGGSAWSDIDFSVNGAITAVKVSSQDNRRIASLQLRYGDTWGNVHGVENKGTLKQWSLPSGDRLVHVEGTSEWGIDSLRFFTQNDCSPIFGDRSSGRQFFWHDSRLFSYFSGRSCIVIDMLEAHFSVSLWIAFGSAAPLLLSPLHMVACHLCPSAGFQGGNAGDKSWSDEGLVRDNRQDDIRAVKAWTGLCGVAYESVSIRGIQFKYGERWSDVHGITTEDEKQWYLDSDEYIHAIDGRSGSRIDLLTFITNKNQSMTFGADGGEKFFWSGGRALYFSGTEKSGDYLVRLQCHWIQ